MPECNTKKEVIKLESWLGMSPQQCLELSVDYHSFPSKDLLEQYSETIYSRSEKEVKSLLRRLLVPSGRFPLTDRVRLPVIQSNIQRLSDDYRESDLRLLLFMKSKGKTPPPWEGITWILDLLPHSPGKALSTLSSYFDAHCLILPDGRSIGLWDAAEVIRARYIGTPESNKEKLFFLGALSSRNLECLVARLYQEKGYSVLLTPKTKDGGKDVVASCREKGNMGRVYIECKQHTKRVGVKIAREFLGVLNSDKANRGVLIATNGFTKNAIELSSKSGRIDLIGGLDLCCLLNEYLGKKWPLSIERLVSEVDKASEKLEACDE